MQVKASHLAFTFLFGPPELGHIERSNPTSDAAQVPAKPAPVPRRDLSYPLLPLTGSAALKPSVYLDTDKTTHNNTNICELTACST